MPDDTEEGWDVRLYRALVISVYAVSAAYWFYLLADYATDHELSRSVDRWERRLRTEISKLAERRRAERETRKAANRVIFEAMQIVQEVTE